MTAKDEAKRYLGDVPQDKCFWVNNGPVLRNLGDLANALETMSDDSFRHHASKEKNDFSSWIGEVIGDKKLAESLKKSKSKSSALKKLKAMLSSLKKKAA